MVDSDAVVGWAGDIGGYVGDFYIGDQDAAAIVPQERQRLQNTSIGRVGDRTEMSFLRPMDPNTGAHPLDPDRVIVIWALGHDTPENRTLSLHYFRHFAMFNLETGVVNFPSDTMHQAHMILMITAFGFVFPAAIILARFGKALTQWYYVHAGLNTLGLILAIAGFGIALNSFSLSARHGHRVIGILIMSLLVLQALLTICKPEKTSARPFSNARHMWELVHHNVGRAVVLLAVAESYYGLTLLQPGAGVVLLYTALITIMGSVFIGLELRSGRLLQHDEGERTSLLGGSPDDSSSS